MGSKMQDDHRLTAAPLYKRAEEAMIARIVSRVWSPGMRLPNELKLATEFGVSQGTIRKALASLEQRGLLARSPGSGTTVLRTTEEEALYAFFRMRDAQGALTVPEPLEERLERRPATQAERAVFGPLGAEVYALDRVRQFEGTPFTVERIRLPAALCDGMERDLPLPNSLYPYLQDRFGVSVMTAEESLTAVGAAEDEARLLRVVPGTPLLRVERRALDLADRIVETRTSHYLTRFASYRVSLTRSGPAPAPPEEA